jgi:adenylate cyclase
MEARHLTTSTRLLLSHAGAQTSVPLDGLGSFMIGRSAECGLRLELPFVSRCHARIERERQYFMLVDESSNGTFVRSEDETVCHVHRASFRLWGAGILSFGQPFSLESVVRFEHVE